jgi:hypothetical protein
MNRYQRRRARAMMRSIDGAIACRIEKIMTTDGDNCSLCRAEFPHNSRALGGVTHDGAVALVGECCASKLASIVSAGLYTMRPYVERARPRNGPDEKLSAEQIEEAITAHQRYFAAVDEVTDTVARRAGVPHMAGRLMLHCEDNAWKDDDRIWFSHNPTRSHRLRPLLPGELSSTLTDDLSVPPGHELQILVRQVEPGLRVRTGFYRNLEIDIPDIEPVIHALFDLMAERRDPIPISVDEVAKLALKYARGGALS